LLFLLYLVGLVVHQPGGIVGVGVLIVKREGAVVVEPSAVEIAKRDVLAVLIQDDNHGGLLVSDELVEGQPGQVGGAGWSSKEIFEAGELGEELVPLALIEASVVWGRVGIPVILQPQDDQLREFGRESVDLVDNGGHGRAVRTLCCRRSDQYRVPR